MFIKVLGSDQRDADLLYRAYRFIRLRDIGDTRPAASLIQAVEHQALAAVMAERTGVAVPAVRQVIKTADGSALLVMERVDGSSLDLVPEQRISDTMRPRPAVTAVPGRGCGKELLAVCLCGLAAHGGHAAPRPHRARPSVRRT